MVKYVDYRTDSIPDSTMLGRFFCKRKSFSHEAEMRAVVSVRQAEEFGVAVPENGILVPVKLQILLEKVYIAPGLLKSCVEDVHRALRTERLDTPVVQSELDDPALY
jgi:hypothetical protein